MKPTVSENNTVSNVLNLKFALLVVVSNVANNLSSAFKPAFVNSLNNEVFPAFVYPTRAISLLLPFFLAYRFKFFWLCCLFNFFLSCLIRLPINLLSVSSWVSPGPLKPIPPFCLSRWLHPLTNRVDRKLSWASSTCSFPISLWARAAKISKINPVLSRTREHNNFSRFLSCEGESSQSKTTNLIFSDSTILLSSSAFPFERKWLADTKFCFEKIWCSTISPEDLASPINSEELNCSRLHWFDLTKSIETIIALGSSGAKVFSKFWNL